MFLIANGGVKGYPKNTKESVLLSKFDNNIDGVLVDVIMTNDHKLVLAENDWVFKNNYISKMNYQDIKKINIKSGVSNYYIPLLEEILLYYDKDILIVKLHHNYDQNESLVLELKNVLKKYYIKKLVIITDNDNLYDHLSLLTDYEMYNLNNSNNVIANFDIKGINYNGKIKLITNHGSKSNNLFMLTNDSKMFKDMYKI